MKKPSGWTNLQDYLAVNEDQGEGMAGKVAGNIAAVGGQAKEQMANANTSLSAQATSATKDTGKAPTTSADAAARAKKSAYSGPAGLDAVDPTLAGNVADAVQRVKTAGTSSGQTAILGEAYGQGRGAQTTAGGMFDSFLLSGANGGATMRDAQAQYGGLEGDYANAQAQGAGTVAAAKGQAGANVSKWDQLSRQLLDKETQDADSKKRSADEASFEAKWQAAQGANAGDEINRAFNAFNSVMSPITQVAHATGNADPVQRYGTKLITPQGGEASGGSNGQKIWWKPQHKEVFRQMDPAQWAELNQLPPTMQSRWLDIRAEEVKAGKPHAAFNSTKEYQNSPFYGI